MMCLMILEYKKQKRENGSEDSATQETAHTSRCPNMFRFYYINTKIQVLSSLN